MKLVSVSRQDGLCGFMNPFHVVIDLISEGFWHGLKRFLDENEWVEADDGYVGDDPQLIKVPKGTQYHANDFEKAAASLV